MKRRLYVGLRGLADGSAIRTAEFEGRDHLVVPVIMMVGDSVVRPLGSTGPEFVPAEELGALPAAWDGEPVMTDHPSIEGQMVSANIPVILETMAFGQCFNTAFRNGSLQTEAWLDREKATALGGDAEVVVERVLAGEIVEVSVGCWITAVHESGKSPTGDSYDSKWTEIAPDHLALLPVGTEGACSVEMGCGTPRAARSQPGWTPQRGIAPQTPDRTRERVLRAAEEDPDMNWKKLIGVMRSLAIRSKPDDTEAREQISALTVTLRAALDSMSDGDLWAALWRALEADVPAFDWIEDVFSAEGLVVYTTWPPDEPLMTWSRSFTVSDSGDVTLGSDPVEVKAVTRFEPVAAEGGQSEPDKTNGNASEGCNCQTPEGETPTMNDSMKALIARLTDGSLVRSPFSAECAEKLAGFDEEKLTAMAASFEDPEPVVEPKVEPVVEPEPKVDPAPVVDPDVVHLSKAEHQTLTALASETEDRNKAQRASLVESLIKKTGDGSKATFEAMDLNSLRQLASDLKINKPKPDFSLSQPVGDPSNDGDDIAPPKTLADAVKARRAVN